MDLQPFIQALKTREDFLLERAIELSAAAEYTRFTSTQEEDWRMTVREPAQALVRYLEATQQPESIHVDEDFQANPSAAFGILEAQRHRERGVRFDMFLGLTKLIRQAFIELIYDTDLTAEQTAQALAVTHRFWDKFELGFCTEWVRHSENDLLEELRDANRRMTNEKNRYLTIFRSMAEPAYVVDPEMNLVAINPALETFHGVVAEQAVGRPCQDVLQHGLCTDCPLQAAMQGHQSFRNLELELELADERRTVLFSGAYLDDVSGKYAGGVALYQDITERQHQRIEIERSERYYRSLVENMLSGVAHHEIVLDDQGAPVDYVFLEANLAFEKLTGLRREDILGKRVTEVIPGIRDGDFDWVAEYGQIALSGEPRLFEQYAEPLDRHYLVSAFSIEPGSFSTVFLDVTEHRKLEAQFQQAQKLESLGVLAGGIAHDFNNLLVGILGNAGLALLDLSPASPARDGIKEIETAAHRAAELCRQMLAYSGKGRFVIRRLHLRDVIEEMLHLLRTSISKSAVLQLNFGESVPDIEADVTQFRQVVMNLITNASEAIGDRSGVIAISTGAMQCDRDYLEATFAAQDLAEGLYAYLEVSDTGAGMDEATRARIFDPFFTTKFTGRGLGLAAVLGIVRGHRGAIKVYSEPGRGTTFKVLLPACEASVEELGVIRVSLGDWRPQGTMLVVDDDETVRAVGKKLLERAGFEVLLASDGREALDLLTARDGQVAAVLLDLTMPHMGGEEAFRELRRRWPDLRIVLSSGYNEQDVTNRFAGKRLSGFVQKPYTAENLLLELKRVLED